MKKKMRINKNQYFLKIAQLASERSTCPRRKVGCVIVNKHNHIMATGYNGVPKSYKHCIEEPCPGAGMASGTGLDICKAIHAEQNALLQCPDTMQIETIYCTTAPCFTCAKLISNTSCEKVIYGEEYVHTEAGKILKECGIILEYERIIN